jgi:hypothetical protein
MNEHVERQRLSLDEGAVRTVRSAVPGLKWETEKDEDKGGHRIKLRHEKSGKILWTLASDVVADDELQSSLQVLDRIWKDTDVDWTQDEKELLGSPHMSSVAGGTARRADAAKKPIRHVDKDAVIYGKLVKFQENVNELDRLQSALRKGEVREDGMEN